MARTSRRAAILATAGLGLAAAAGNAVPARAQGAGRARYFVAGTIDSVEVLPGPQGLEFWIQFGISIGPTDRPVFGPLEYGQPLIKAPVTLPSRALVDRLIAATRQTVVGLALPGVVVRPEEIEVRVFGVPA